MNRFYAFFVFLFCTCFASAQQSYVHQIIFLNEGWYDFVNGQSIVPPSVGAYDVATDTYATFDEIPEADFASDVLVDDVIYVAADNLLITYDKNSLERLQMRTVEGIRKLAVWGDQLLVSRGDYLVHFDSYLQVYDKHSLELLYALDTLTGPRYASEGIIVDGDMAYVAINNGFEFGQEVGIVGMINLQSQVYAGEIDLGPEGINPDNIMMSENNIYTLNNKDYTNSSISRIDPVGHTVSTFDHIAANSGCGTSVLADAHIYYMEYGVDKLARYNIQSDAIVDTLAGTAAYYGLIDDKINNRLIATYTDFFSTGTAYFLDYSGNVMHSFDVGISPGNIALDVRMSTGINEPAWPESLVTLSPNPSRDVVRVIAEEKMSQISVRNAKGELLSNSIPSDLTTTIDLRAYSSGVYLIEVGLVRGGSRTYRVVKTQ